jgi:CheY-like chemotaxis protein
VSQKHYAVVILDLVMPKMSGVDFLDSLTAMMKDPSIHTLADAPAVIVVTATPAGEVPTDTLEQRSPLVKVVMRKPVDIERLAEIIESL